MQCQELLGVVFSIEYFKIYLYGKHFIVVTGHRALLFMFKENCSNILYNSRLTRWIDRLLPFQFDIEHMPGAKMGLVDYISRNPNQKATKKFPHTMKNFVVAKLDLISAFVNPLNVNISQSAHLLLTLLQLHDFKPQITPNNKPAIKSINTISTFGTRSHTHDFYLSPAPQNQSANTSCNSNNSECVYSAPQIPISTSLD